MPYRVIVQPKGDEFFVEDNETILEAALRCGYFFPHSCRMGVCATCKGKVLQGNIHYDGMEILGLTQSEQQAGFALCCMAKPQSDLIIHVNHVEKITTTQPKTIAYEVIRHELLAPDISQILLQSKTTTMPYQAGQYLEIVMPDQRLIPMSIALAPYDLSLIALHLFHPASNQEARMLLQTIQQEKNLLLRGAFGDCTIAKMDLQRPIIFIARGTGFAPIKAVIEEFLQMKKIPPMHFYWMGEHYLESLVTEWQRELKDFRYTPITTQSVIETILADYPDLTRHQVYAVESENAVYEILFALMRRGLSREFFYSDVFAYSNRE